MMPRNDQTNIRWERLNGAHVEADPSTLSDLRLMQASNCKALLALSECSVGIQGYAMSHIDGDFDRQAIMAKTSYLHPPQEPLISEGEIEEKFEALTSDRKLELAFVGAEFFRKGGDVMVEALSGLSKDADIHLTVVSRLEAGDYVTHATGELAENWKKRLSDLPWVTWHDGLPNQQVLGILRRAHAGFLPTLADTYGYSVLEMQAAGCPVVSSNVRALPEINGDSYGWVIELPLNEHFREAEVYEPQGLEENRTRLRKGVRESVEAMLDDPARLRKRALASLERIRRTHDPGSYGLALAHAMGLAG